MVFTYPWFLLGLLSLAVPLVIHLFELRRPKRVMFTNVSFIREVKLIAARQRKLKHLLVLLARLGFLGFLVLMFTQPYLPALVEVGKFQEVVGVIVDTTPSMQAGEVDEQSAFERATTQAQELPSAYSAGTSFRVPSEQAQPLSAAAYQLVIEKSRVSGQSIGLGNAFSRLEGGSKRPGQTFVLSDFQKNSFSARNVREFDSTQQVFLVPVGGKEVRNVFVDSVWLDDAFVRSNADVMLHVRLRNGGNTAVDNCQVKLFIGDRQAAVFRTTVVPERGVTTTVRVRLEGTQVARCRIEVEDYPVTFDNSFYFALQPSPKINVLDVLTTAAATQQVYANEPLFSYSAAQQAGVDYRKLEKADMVVVQAQPRIDAGLRESLRRVVQRGGSLAIVPPAEAGGRASYDQLFRELGIGPVQWEAAGAAPILREVAVPNAQNPFFKEVFGMQSRQPAMPKASPVLRWSRSGTDIMRLRDGDGFLAGFVSGKGTVYLFSAPFGKTYSDFTQHPLFVPVMYRLAMQSYQRTQQPAYRLNQGTIAVNLPGGATAGGSEQIFKLTKDSATFIPGQRVQAGVLRFDTPPGMREPGFYSLIRNGQVLTTLAFNYDKRESDMATYSAAELRQLIGPNRPNVQVYEASTGASVAAQYRAERVGKPLWQYCLWAALACLLAEVLLLRFVGRPKVAETIPVAA